VRGARGGPRPLAADRAHSAAERSAGSARPRRLAREVQRVACREAAGRRVPERRDRGEQEHVLRLQAVLQPARRPAAAGAGRPGPPGDLALPAGRPPRPRPAESLAAASGRRADLAATGRRRGDARPRTRRPPMKENDELPQELRKAIDDAKATLA